MKTKPKVYLVKIDHHDPQKFSPICYLVNAHDPYKAFNITKKLAEKDLDSNRFGLSDIKVIE